MNASGTDEKLVLGLTTSRPSYAPRRTRRGPQAQLQRFWAAIKSHLISSNAPSLSGTVSVARSATEGEVGIAQERGAAGMTGRQHPALRRPPASRSRASWWDAEPTEEEIEAEANKAIDAVVVDRNFNDSLSTDIGDAHNSSDRSTKLGTPELHPFLNFQGADRPVRPRPTTGHSSRSGHEAHNSTAVSATTPSRLDPLLESPLYLFLRYRLFANVAHFFHSPFPDPAKERAYIKEVWFGQKPAALAAAFFLLLASIMAIIALPQPYTTYVKITYCGIALVTVVPLFPLAAFDAPRRWPWTWQFFLFCGTWSYPYTIIIDVWHCGLYKANSTCGDRMFTTLFYYALGFPVFALFMLQASRLAETAGAVTWIILAAVLIVPDRVKFVRLIINFALFHCAITYAQFLREKSDRRMFTLRDQLKQQYRATQLAQVAERAASESKKRFVSYIFHEVRVPLNTALLAFQNLDGEKMFDEVPPDQREMVTGLNSSLGTMKNVLNDVLDFSRMEAGKLTWTNKPFNINATFRAMLMAFRGVAAARKINLLTDFDPAIDAYSPLLLGDEMRLSQVISNLTSNACKFTQNGSVTFVTRLLYPSSTTDSRDSESRESSVQKSWEDIELHGLPDSRRGSEIPELPEYRRDIAIVRIEIQDSGVGIAVQDLVDNRLFSPYVQTDEGRRQGGKGSGLGLALVRKIVKLSGGRLGVTSVLGKGSTFWLEMPFRKPSQAVLDEHAMSTSLSAPDISFDAEPAPTASPAVNTEDATSSTTSPTVLQTPDIESAMLCVPPPASPAEERSTPLGTPFCLQVLVVDDDPLTRKLLQRLLERLGCSVTLATNGQEALDILLGVDGQAPRVFDMISLDNSMPILVGPDAVRRLRKAGRKDFVVGATGNALRTDQVLFLEAGADMVLTKPVLLKDLKSALSLAESRRSQLA